MDILTIAGPPSCGKTSVILHLAKAFGQDGKKLGVIKFDCLSALDTLVYQANNILVQSGVSGNMCPDHFYVSNIESGIQWAKSQSCDVLAVESAGLCNRCSPHIKGIPAICVVDNLSGTHTPSKIGPMLRFADMVVITKGDIVSQAEREVFSYAVQQANPHASALPVNGITGQGLFLLYHKISEYVRYAEHTDELRLRFTMPSALCSYCLGQTRIGKDYQMGNWREMKFEDTIHEG